MLSCLYIASLPGILMVWLQPCCRRIKGGMFTTGELLIKPVSALIVRLPLTWICHPEFPLITADAQFPLSNLHVQWHKKSLACMRREHALNEKVMPV